MRPKRRICATRSPVRPKMKPQRPRNRVGKFHQAAAKNLDEALDRAAGLPEKRTGG